jgi:hypothetical protein
MLKVILSSLLLGSTTFAMPTDHTGYCYYGEDCGVVVSQDIDEAREICSQNAFATEPVHVRQEQADGSVVWIGYVCATPMPGGRVSN